MIILFKITRIIINIYFFDHLYFYLIYYMVLNDEKEFN
jgi:hypothetical protein